MVHVLKPRRDFAAPISHTTAHGLTPALLAACTNRHKCRLAAARPPVLP